MHLNDVLINLKIIGHIKEFDKIRMEDHIEIDSPGYWRGMSRWWRGETRDSTIIFLNNIICGEAFRLIDEIMVADINGQQFPNSVEPNRDLLQKFLVELKNAVTGLQNLKVTYVYDISFKSQLDVITEAIQFRLEKLRQYLNIQDQQIAPQRAAAYIIPNPKKPAIIDPQAPTSSPSGR